MAFFPSRRGNLFQNQPMPQLLTRRATVDDLPALRALWQATHWPADELESRLTEFQVVEADGHFAGALAVQIVRQHLRLHSEDYADFSVADAARERFWERLQKLAASHGVFRVWTQETSPFWTHWGFQPANAETLQRLPDEWKNLEGQWLTLALKNEDAINEALKNRLPDLLADEKARTAEIARKGRQLRTFFTVFFFALAAGLFGVAIYLLMHQPLTSR
jgi:N-acetylglutamate synthase-like GNAT family acetyltransferase